MKFTNLKHLVVKFIGGGQITLPTKYLKNVNIEGHTDEDIPEPPTPTPEPEPEPEPTVDPYEYMVDNLRELAYVDPSLTIQSNYKNFVIGNDYPFSDVIYSSSQDDIKKALFNTSLNSNNSGNISNSNIKEIIFGRDENINRVKIVYDGENVVQYFVIQIKEYVDINVYNVHEFKFTFNTETEYFHLEDITTYIQDLNPSPEPTPEPTQKNIAFDYSDVTFFDIQFKMIPEDIPLNDPGYTFQDLFYVSDENVFDAILQLQRIYKDVYFYGPLSYRDISDDTLLPDYIKFSGNTLYMYKNSLTLTISIDNDDVLDTNCTPSNIHIVRTSDYS